MAIETLCVLVHQYQTMNKSMYRFLVKIVKGISKIVNLIMIANPPA